VTIWRKGFVKEMRFKAGVKGRGSGDESEGGDCDEVNVICVG